MSRFTWELIYSIRWKRRTMKRKWKRKGKKWKRKNSQNAEHWESLISFAQNHHRLSLSSNVQRLVSHYKFILPHEPRIKFNFPPIDTTSVEILARRSLVLDFSLNVSLPDRYRKKKKWDEKKINIARTTQGGTVQNIHVTRTFSIARLLSQ